MATTVDPAPKNKGDQKQLEEKFSDELTSTPAPEHHEMMPENPEDSDATKAEGDHDDIAKEIREGHPDR